MILSNILGLSIYLSNGLRTYLLPCFRKHVARVMRNPRTKPTAGIAHHFRGVCIKIRAPPTKGTICDNIMITRAHQ